jgi:hypothetical protein
MNKIDTVYSELQKYKKLASKIFDIENGLDTQLDDTIILLSDKVYDLLRKNGIDEDLFFNKECMGSSDALELSKEELKKYFKSHL